MAENRNCFNKFSHELAYLLEFEMRLASYLECSRWVVLHLWLSDNSSIFLCTQPQEVSPSFHSFFPVIFKSASFLLHPHPAGQFHLSSYEAEFWTNLLTITACRHPFYRRAEILMRKLADIKNIRMMQFGAVWTILPWDFVRLEKFFL